MKLIFGPAKCSVPEPQFDRNGKLVSYPDLRPFIQKYTPEGAKVRMLSRR